MSDSIYHMILRSHCNFISGVICHAQRCKICHFITLPENLYTTSGLSILIHGVISLPDARAYDQINYFKPVFSG